MESNLTVAEAAYIAGIIDGEGCVAILKKKQAGYNPTYTPRLIVANTNLPLILWLKETTGLGNVTKRKKRQKAHHKCSYNWALYSSDLKLLLPQVKQYLLCKSEQVVAVEKLMSLKHPGSAGFSKEALQTREDLFQTARTLNKRSTK